MTQPRTPEVWEPFVDALRGFVARRVPVAEADDVLQDVLLRLHQAAPTLRDAEKAEAWVYGIARRTVADHFRQRPTPEGTDDPNGLEDPTTPPENLAAFQGDHDVHEEVLSWLRPFAEALDEPDRTAVLMADFEGRTQREVADHLGLSLSGAKSRVQRARARLGDALQACCEVEFGPDARARAFRRVHAEARQREEDAHCDECETC